jgi:uncharacterized protein
MLRVFILSFFLLLCSCGEPATKVEDLNTLEITFPNGGKVTAEMMTRELDLARGMMFRDSLADDRGVLLIHAKVQPWQMWMRNVRIALDVVWMDRDRRVVEIVRNTAPCPATKANECPRYGGTTDSMYILELNAGRVAKEGLKLGDVVSF